jgi:mycofactocin system glycosyltransferase
MKPLAYGLGKGAFTRMREGRLYLVLPYPLKAIVLHAQWRALFDRMTQGILITLDELAGLLPGRGRREIAGFLDKLVLKGFVLRQGVDSPEELPLVSVIIPVRNRPQEIDACLHSLERLDYPADKLEIIVVDDASDDHTPFVAAGHPVRLIRLEQHRQASFCRNLGARQAGGEILAFIDSDCRADPLWLRQLVPAFSDAALTALGGKVDAWHERRRLDRYEKAKSSLMVADYVRRTGPDNPFFYVPACNFLVRRAAFLAKGGFDAQLTVGEDVDLCWRLQKSGHELEFRPEGVVYHKHRSQLGAFCRRRFDYGTSEPLLQKMHPYKVKTLVTPPTAVLFWSLMVAWLASGLTGLGVTALLLPWADSLLHAHRYRRLPVGWGLVLSATLREYAAFAYHLCAFTSRYYLVWGVLCAPIAPLVSLVVAAMHLLNGSVEYWLKKPSLGLVWFLAFFTCEQASYQMGVFWGCLRHQRWSPLLPVPNPRVS